MIYHYKCEYDTDHNINSFERLKENKKHWKMANKPYSV